MKKFFVVATALSLVITTPAFADVAKPTDSLAAIQSTAVTLSPEEMAKVRGEWGMTAIRLAVDHLNQDNISGFRKALGLNGCRTSSCRWASQNPQAFLMWARTYFDW